MQYLGNAILFVDNMKVLFSSAMLMNRFSFYLGVYLRYSSSSTAKAKKKKIVVKTKIEYVKQTCRKNVVIVNKCYSGIHLRVFFIQPLNEL